MRLTFKPSTWDRTPPEPLHFLSGFFFFFFRLVCIYLYVLPFVFFHRYFLITCSILFTNFSRVEFEYMFSFVSLLFISLLWLFLWAKEAYIVWLWCTAINRAKITIIYWTPKITHQFSNALNMALTLNFCVLGVNGAVAFKFMLPLYHL